MNRAYYSDTISNFLKTSSAEIIGNISLANEFDLGQTQRDAWIEEIKILKEILLNYTGQIYFEYSIPRIGHRIDVLLVIDSVIFILEFKVGEKTYTSYAIDQVTDYALDFKKLSRNKPKQIYCTYLNLDNGKRLTIAS